jgi:ketosteroid isomerase-like protein
MTQPGGPAWVEPYPDALLGGTPDETMALAFVAALQCLPPWPRAVLLLRDVLGFRAAEVAGMLDSSEAAVNSALQQSRATMAARLPRPGRDGATAPRPARERELAGQFAAAYAADDIDAVVALLTEDAWYAMPPVPLTYQGRAAIGGFLRDCARWRGDRRQRLIPTRANGQPAFACYCQDSATQNRATQDSAIQNSAIQNSAIQNSATQQNRATPVFRAHGLIVLTLEGEQICAITRFLDNGVLRPFGLPRTL